MIRFIIILIHFICLTVAFQCPLSAKEKEEAFDDSKISESTLEIKKKAYLALNQCEYKHALILSDSLRKVGIINGDQDYSIVHSYIVDGQANTMLGNPDLAFRSLQEALSMAKRMNYYDALSSIHNGLAIYQEYINNDIYAAISNYYSAIDNAQKAGNKRRLSILLNNLGGAYQKHNDPECITYSKKALEMGEEIGDSIAIFYAYLNLAEFSVWRKDQKNSYNYISKAKRYAEECGIDAYLDVLVIEARYYQMLGEHYKALSICEEIMDKIKEDTPIPSLSAAYLVYSSVLASNKKYDLALKTAKNGLEKVKAKGSFTNEPEFIDELIRIYQDKGDYETALLYSNKAIQNRDSTYTVSRERGVEEAKIKYEIYEKEKTIDEQQKELSSSRMRILILSVFGCLVIIILCLVVYNYQKQKKLYKSIVMQHKQNIQREEMLMEELEKQQQKKQDSKTASQDKNDSIMSSFTALMMKEKMFRDATISLDKIAKLLGTNRTYLSRAINETSGKTFSQIVNEFRIREAISLMEENESTYPLKVISGEVGFSSISTFYSTFTAMIGLSPAKYRSQLKNM